MGKCLQNISMGRSVTKTANGLSVRLGAHRKSRPASALLATALALAAVLASSAPELAWGDSRGTWVLGTEVKSPPPSVPTSPGSSLEAGGNPAHFGGRQSGVDTQLDEARSTSQGQGTPEAPATCTDVVESKEKCLGFNVAGFQFDGFSVGSMASAGFSCEDKVAQGRCKLTNSQAHKLTAVRKNVNECRIYSKAAQVGCLEFMSPVLQGLAAWMSGAAAAKDAYMAINKSCKKQSEILDTAQKAVAAYNAACGAAMVACQMGCKGLIAASAADLVNCQGIIAACDASPEKTCQTSQPVLRCRQETPIYSQSNPAAAALVEACSGYTKNLASAAASIVAINQQKRTADKCQADTEVADCSKDPNAKGCRIDCNAAENQTNKECICARTPGAVGCEQYAGSQLASSYDKSGIHSSALGKGKDLGNPTSGLPGMDGKPDKAGLAAGGAVGGGGGGGGLGGGGGGSGGGGAGKGQDKAGGRVLNTNILSGDYGGGGGGRGGGFGSAGLDEGGDPLKKYRPYMPGGEKIEVRNPASAQVTGGGGKSNWEKVKDRYRDFGSSVMGQ